MNQKVLQHLQVHGRVPNNALLANLFPAGLELWLNQTGNFAALSQKTVKGRENQLEGNKGDVDRCKIQFIRNLLSGQIPCVGALHTDHALIIAQLPIQLAIANIHGIDLLCAVLQHAIRESPGGGTDVGADLAAQV